MSTKAVNDGLDFAPESNGQGFVANVVSECKSLVEAFRKARLMEQLLAEGISVDDAYRHVFDEKKPRH